MIIEKNGQIEGRDIKISLITQSIRNYLLNYYGSYDNIPENIKDKFDITHGTFKVAEAMLKDLLEEINKVYL